MNTPPRATGALFLLVVLHTVDSSAAGPAVDASALAHCAAITGADERLTCYDALAHRTLYPPAAAAVPPGPSVPGAAAVTTAQGAPASAVPQNFGLSRHEQTAPNQPDNIHAVVTETSADRQGNVYVTLDNGQQWTFNASDSPVRPNDKVTIERAALGSFLLVTANRHSYHVRRVR